MDKDVIVDGKILVDGKPGRRGEVLTSQGSDKSPAWTSLSKSLAKSRTKEKNKAAGQESDSRIQNILSAVGQESYGRIQDILSSAFPLLNISTYKRALSTLPGVDFASSVAKRAGLFEKKKEKGESEDGEIEQGLLAGPSLQNTVLENILGEVVKIREVLESGVGKTKKGSGRMQAIDTRDPRTAPGDLEYKEQLKESYSFEEPKGRGKGKGRFRSLKTGRYVKKEEATAVKKADVVPKKSGIIGRAGQAIGGVGRAVVGGVMRAGAAAVGAAGTALPWLAAFAAILPFFLPSDIKSVIGDIFRGLLEGIGLDKETIDAIFVPFQILSDVADVIKKVLGLLWDGIKKIAESIGKIIDWVGSRGNVNASEEVSRATGGTGHGEFTTGGEGYDASVPIPEAPEKSTPSAGEKLTGDRSTKGPAAAAVTTPLTSANAPAAAPAAPAPAMVTPPTLDKDVEEYFNKPENAAEKLKLDDINTRIVTFKNAIITANQAISQETDPEKKKNYEFVLKRQLEPGLKNAEKAKDLLIENAKKAATPVQAAPATPPPSFTPNSEGALGSGGAGGGGGGGGGAPEGGEAGSGGSEGVPTPSAEPVSTSPSTGQQIDEQSKQIEAERAAGPTPEGSTNIIDKGEIAAGTEEEISTPVPSPIAPRDKLDLDIFFTAVA